MTAFERAKIRLEAFQLLAGWGITEKGDPQAKKLVDQLPTHTPWDLATRMKRADELADWAMRDVEQ